MKKLILTAAGLVVLSACNKPSETNTTTVKNEQIAVGADQDDHGCKASAGQTWSELKQNCIQVFNEGFRLNPVIPPKEGAVTSAFILMSDDQNKAELFLPDQADHHSIILTKDDKGIYENRQYRFDSVKSVLFFNGKEQYKGNVE